MKSKFCPSCEHKNISFADNCEQCNTGLKGLPIYEKPDPRKPFTWVNFAFMRIFGLILTMIIIAILFVLSLIFDINIFNLFT